MGRFQSAWTGVIVGALASAGVLGSGSGCSEQRSLRASSSTTTTASLSLSAVTPASGSPTGGQVVTVQGTGFAAGAVVWFGATPSTTVTLQSNGSLVAVTPAGGPATVTVTVTNPGGASASLVAGYTWVGPHVEQSTDPANQPAIALDGTGAIHVVWQATPSGASVIRWSTSSDGGATWSAPQALSAPGATASRPRIAARGGRIGVVWNDGGATARRVRYCWSFDHGTSWSTPATAIPFSNTSPDPDCAWNSAGDLAISYVAPGVATNGGATPVLVWVAIVSPTSAGSAPIAISGANTIASGQAIAADGATVAVVWTRADNIPPWQPPNHIKVSMAVAAVSPDDGYSFGVPTQLDPNATLRDAAQPAVSVAGPAMSVVWRAPQVAAISQFDDICLVRSIDGGVSWSPVVTVAGGGTLRRQTPAVVTYGAALVTSVVWAESATGAPDVFRVDLNFGAPAGPRTNVSRNAGLSLTPQIAAGAGAVATARTVWADHTAGPSDILIK